MQQQHSDAQRTGVQGGRTHARDSTPAPRSIAPPLQQQQRCSSWPRTEDWRCALLFDGTAPPPLTAMSAVLDILGLDPSAPQVPAASASRKPAAVAHAAPVTKAPTPTASSAASSASSRPAVPARPQRATSSSNDVELENFSQMRVTARDSDSSAPSQPGSLTSISITQPHSAPSRAHFHRARWVDHQLALRASEFTDTKELLLFAGTWNVNAKKPRDEVDLAPWLLHRIRCKGGKAGADDDAESGDDAAASASSSAAGGGGKEKQFKAPDIYVIGFQEIVDLNAGNLLVDHRQWRRDRGNKRMGMTEA